MNKQDSAVKTLESLGYTYKGGELWKPPIGNAPDFNLMDKLHARIKELESEKELAYQKGKNDACDLVKLLIEKQN